MTTLIKIATFSFLHYDDKQNPILYLNSMHLVVIGFYYYCQPTYVATALPVLFRPPLLLQLYVQRTYLRVRSPLYCMLSL